MVVYLYDLNHRSSIITFDDFQELKNYCKDIKFHHIKITEFFDTIISIDFTDIETENITLNDCVINNVIVKANNVYINNSRIGDLTLRNDINEIIINNSYLNLTSCEEVRIDNIEINNSNCYLNSSFIYPNNYYTYIKIIINNLISKSSKIISKGHIEINLLKLNYSIIDFSILGIYFIDKIESIHCIYLNDALFYTAKEVSTEEDNISFNIKGNIDVYKKVVIIKNNKILYNDKYKNEFAILKGTLFNDSKVIKSTENKYRTNKIKFSKVVYTSCDIKNKRNIKFVSIRNINFTYKLNKIIEIENFDERYINCSNGIHFFYDRRRSY